MQIAVIFAPGAGNSKNFRRIGSLLSERLEAHNVISCAGAYGGDFLNRCETVNVMAGLSYIESLSGAVRALANSGADLLICVGGDGLASYAASTLIDAGLRLPIMGIGAGTANVGPIVSMDIGTLRSFDIGKLSFVDIGGIRISCGESCVAYAFNDVVIGNTFLGTVDSKTVSLSVEAMAARGEKTVVVPNACIATAAFRVEKNGAAVDGGMPRPAQIIVSPLGEREFRGRAVSGVLCEAAYSPPKAAMALLDAVLVKPCGVERGLSDFAHVDHLLFGPGDTVSLSGLSGKAHIVADGNPFIRQADRVEFEYLPGIVTVAKSADISTREGDAYVR